MTESSPTPDSPPENPPLHIAGAGTFVLGILLVSLSMLFLASIVAYLFIRAQTIARMGDHPQWPPPGLPHAPSSLWLSTLVIIVSSITIQLALNAVRRDDEKKLVRYLAITTALGLLFLILQAYNWYEFYKAIDPAYKIEGAWLGMFYTLTGLHAAHVIGGLIPLAVTTWNAKHSRYSRNYHPGVRYTTLYWHFLDVIWIALFITLKL
jgi:cytochrome c oxidase subunit 3